MKSWIKLVPTREWWWRRSSQITLGFLVWVIFCAVSLTSNSDYTLNRFGDVYRQQPPCRMNRLHTRQVRNRRACIHRYRQMCRLSISSSRAFTTRHSPNLQLHLDRRWSPTTHRQVLHSSSLSSWWSLSRPRWSSRKRHPSSRTSRTSFCRASCSGVAGAVAVSSLSSAPVSKFSVDIRGTSLHPKLLFSLRIYLLLPVLVHIANKCRPWNLKMTTVRNLDQLFKLETLGISGPLHSWIKAWLK